MQRNFSNLLAIAALSVSVSAVSLPVIAASESDSKQDSKSQISTTNGDAPISKSSKSKGKLIANVQPSSSEGSKDKSDANAPAASDESNASEAQSYFEQERKSRKRKYAHASSTVYINAPQEHVWKTLIDFEHYPEYFKRIDTCHITKREHGLLYAETYLKPQMFVKKLCQHTVTDISQGPNYLQWKMLDGNFTSVVGSWKLSTTKDKKGNPVCQAEYILEADPGPVIPSPLVSFLLHQIEHEVVTNFKKACEQSVKAGDSNAYDTKAPSKKSVKE